MVRVDTVMFFFFNLFHFSSDFSSLSSVNSVRNGFLYEWGVVLGVGCCCVWM